MKFFGELGFLEANKTNEDPATESVANPAPELVEETKIGVDIMENLGGSLSAAQEEEAPSVAEASTASVDPHYAAAVRCYLRGELDEALENLQKVKAEGKDLGEVYTAMAQIYLDRKEFAQAAEHYAELLKLEPENATAQFNAGLSLQATENYEGAQRAFQSAIQLDGELVDAYLGVAGCCLKLNDPQGAKAAYEAYLKVEPDAYTAVFGLGVAYHLSEDHEKAIECYKAALKQQPESEEVLANLAGVYMKQEEYEQAESAFRSLLKLAPESRSRFGGPRVRVFPPGEPRSGERVLQQARCRFRRVPRGLVQPGAGLSKTHPFRGRDPGLQPLPSIGTRHNGCPVEFWDLLFGDRQGLGSQGGVQQSP